MNGTDEPSVKVKKKKKNAVDVFTGEEFKSNQLQSQA